MASAGIIGVLPALLFLFYLVIAGLGLYALILFIKLARRGIEALDIYLRDNRGR
ncbi:hypothetical protein U9M73_04080 [Paenibacillus phoenicis]|uniref:Uncharacterized protein n=1 Tax=Paenibacillus phoenicis TaxID=554117 RepID=A0ABU5PH22_9BACL|nr:MULTISPECIES: hypothetical protein [Paenibacillus]EES74955.1 hypothetical protein POTG_00186 [Paenibacillus sp. oral taxon 786 str. D14]MCT2197558.1 hypothetical protein [Paenibacillus sp. p3-SID1389]MEA3569170.1 hypothetical protein [Paenibacillus phoenicis]